MMQIALFHEGYNWDSYSLVRSMHDVLTEREDVEYLTAQNADNLEPGGYMWLYSSQLGLTKENYHEMKERGLKVVNFGLSDPNMFQEGRLKVCDVYCTNDLGTYKKYKDKYNVYHFVYAVDHRFVKKDVKKDLDVLFIGTLSHAYIPLRKPHALKLMKEIFTFEGYGEGFDRFLNGEELVNTFNRAHLNIDLCTKHSALASRIFQAAACGVPTLTLKRDDILECFKDGKEILTYEGGYEDMVYVIEDALKRKEWLAEIGENARQRCLKDHGMRKRVDDLIKYLGENNAC